MILAATSATPVMEATWVTPGAYVTTLRPKQQGRAEFALNLPATASLLVSDTPDQIGA